MSDGQPATAEPVPPRAGPPVPWPLLVVAAPVVAAVVLLLAGTSSAAGLVAAALVELGVVAVVYVWSGKV